MAFMVTFKGPENEKKIQKLLFSQKKSFNSLGNKIGITKLKCYKIKHVLGAPLGSNFVKSVWNWQSL